MPEDWQQPSETPSSSCWKPSAAVGTECRCACEPTGKVTADRWRNKSEVSKAERLLPSSSLLILVQEMCSLLPGLQSTQATLSSGKLRFLPVWFVRVYWPSSSERGGAPVCARRHGKAMFRQIFSRQSPNGFPSMDTV